MWCLISLSGTCRTIANWASYSGPPVRDFGDISYLVKERYEEGLRKLISKAQVWHWKEKSIAAAPQNGVYLLLYRFEDYQQLAVKLPIWPVESRPQHLHLTEVPLSSLHSPAVLFNGMI